MSLGGFPEHATDENPLLNEYGVQVKSSCQYVSPKDFYLEKSKADDILTERDNKPVVCFLEERSSQRKPCQCLSASGAILALVFCGCLYAYLVHIDHKYSTEVADLRQELKQLAHLCRPDLPRSGNSDDDVAAESAAGIVDSDDIRAGRGWSLDTIGILSKDSRDGLSDWNQAGQGGLTDDHNNVDEVENDDDDDDDDDTAVEDSSDEDTGDNPGEVNTEGKELLHRIWRRSADKPKKKRKGGSCKRYKRCKRAQDRGAKLNDKCQATMGCFKVQDKGAPVNKTCRKILACAPKEPSHSTEPPRTAKVTPFYPRPVHFFSDFWNGRRQQEFGKEPCIYVDDWKGTACRNRTVKIHKSYTPLKFLQGADWMKAWYKNQSEQPILKGSNGGFIVKQSGLYLIYSSVMFHDLKPRQSQAVVVNRQKLFKCMDSVDYVDTDLPAGTNRAKYKTCAMIGVTHLSENDRLEVQNLYDNTEIDLSTDATYFGAVLFSPGEVKASSGNSQP